MGPSSKRALLLVVVLVALIGGTLVARANLGGAAGVTIPYAGHLEVNGLAVSGSATFTAEVFVDDVAATPCYTATDITSPVYAGAFAIVIGGVPEACVVGTDVHLAFSVDTGSGPVSLGGRVRVHPAVGALTSGQGDFAVHEDLDVGGLVTASDVATDNDVAAGGDVAAAGNVAASGNVSAGNQVVSNGNVYAAANGPNTSLAMGRIDGFTDFYLGITRSNHSSQNGYALLTSETGDTFVNAETGRSLYLRVGNADRASVGPSGGMTVYGTGGNVAHGCVTRIVNNSYTVGCAGGEVAVGGGGRCASLFRMTESSPWDVNANTPPGNGGYANGWRTLCQVWGNAGNYTPPYEAYAVCCQH